MLTRPSEEQIRIFSLSLIDAMHEYRDICLNIQDKHTKIEEAQEEFDKAEAKLEKAKGGRNIWADDPEYTTRTILQNHILQLAEKGTY